MSERVRFSPAPTGLLHLGGAHTALFNHLVARHEGGEFVLRFEDTDMRRADASFESGIVEDLEWLGIMIDEGPASGGPHAPYRQSERAGVYADALGRLVEAGHVYPCFCSAEELARGREADVEEGRAPRYHGSCRLLDRETAAARVDAGQKHCWRFAVPAARDIVVDDVVHGPVRFSSDEVGDFVVARSTGETLYDLACVVDDAGMAITLVIRGDDHLPNTPRQLLIFEALGSPPPRYAHVPLVRGTDGRPLSKSRGSEAVAELRQQGFLPQAVVNHLALLGWSDPSEREVLTPAELVEAFTIDRVSPSPSTHDAARLHWLNARHTALLPRAERAALLQRFLPNVPGLDPAAAADLLADEIEEAGDAREALAWADAPLPFDAEASTALRAPSANAALAIAVDESGRGFGAVRQGVKAAGLPVREAMPALRAALTGRAHGLPVSTVFALLGPDEARRRLVACAGA
jgi:nondiscriminating glutamyl-tRNA synthetase